VALAFVPSTIAAVGAVREADRARTGGRVVRRGRLLRQVVPVLETGMERAVGLAESMDSRGFGHRPASGADAAAGWVSLVALLSLGGCFLALIARATATAAVLATIGGGGVIGAVVLASRSTGRVRYRKRRLSPRDWAIAAVAWLAPLTLLALSATDDASLVWPGATVALPALNVVAVAGLTALAVPMLRRTAT
jgi:energy-coupling factor transport system permease protein